MTLENSTSLNINALPPPMRRIGMLLREAEELLEKLNGGHVGQKDVRVSIKGISEKIHNALSLIDQDGISMERMSEEVRLKQAEEANRQKFLARMDQAIINSLEGGNMNIECLTDCLCMSRSTLYRRVKSLTGISANEYIRRKRMEMAKELLIAGDMPMSEIAYRVGCSSMSYFRQTFKDIYGVIPSEYLRRLKS